MHHSYWSPRALEPGSRTRKPPQRETWAPQPACTPCLAQLEQAPVQQRRPRAAKNKRKRKKPKQQYSPAHICRKRNTFLILLSKKGKVTRDWNSARWGVLQGARVMKNPPANARDIRDAGSIPRSGRSLGGGNGNPPQYSCLENPMDRGVWWATSVASQRVGHDWSDLARTRQSLLSLCILKNI